MKQETKQTVGSNDTVGWMIDKNSFSGTWTILSATIYQKGDAV